MNRGLSIIAALPWPDGEAPPAAATLPELLEYQAATIPDAEALVAGDKRYTYRELNAEVGRAAVGLAGLGVVRGSHVALLAPNVSEWVVTAFAAHRLGAVLESFNTWVKAWDLRHLLGSSGAEVLVMAPSVRSLDLLSELRELAPDIWESGKSAEFPRLRHIVVLDGEFPTPVPPGTIAYSDILVDGPVPVSAALADDTAYILYTSGTTSLPKAVPLAHRALIENGYAIGSRMGLTPADRVWLGSPMFWSYGCANAAMAAFGHGSCLVLQERFTPETAAALMAAESCTAAYLLPSITSAFVQDALAQIRAVSTLRTGLVIGTAEEFRQTSIDLDIAELCNVYGSTETYGNCCVTAHTMPIEDRMHCQGPPLPGVEVRAVNAETGEIVPLGEAGEFQVRGRIMSGYIGNPEANAEAFTEDGWFRTRDTGLIRPDGTVSFVGRATDMIKTSGINVSPAEVENFIATHPVVAEVGVVGAPHPTRGEVVVAYVVTTPDASISAEELIAFCKRALSGFKVPWAIAFVDALPRTSTGKMMRRDLREPAAALVESTLTQSGVRP